jgi:hypothetical protein
VVLEGEGDKIVLAGEESVVGHLEDDQIKRGSTEKVRMSLPECLGRVEGPDSDPSSLSITMISVKVSSSGTAGLDRLDGR